MIKFRRMRWAGYVAHMGERRDVYRCLVGTADENRLLGRPRHRWEDNIKMDVQEVGCECMDWTDVA
jgi:hypothetical protein